MSDHSARRDRDEQPANRVSTDGGSPTVDLTGDGPHSASGFFDALSEGRLIGGRCEDCDEVLIPPRPACHSCGGWNVAIEDLPGTGTIVSHTQIHKSAPAFEALTPFPVAIVELDSGGRLPGRVDASYEDISIGDPVTLSVRELTDGERSFALDHEAEWPIHVFVPGDD